MIKGIRINKSKIVHLYCAVTDRTDCGAGGMDSVSFNGGVETAEAVTCKRCLKAMAADAELAARVATQMQETVDFAHAEAVEMDELRTMARAYLSTPSGVVLTEAEIDQAIAKRYAENEAFFDALAIEYAHADATEENQRREFAPVAAPRSRRQRRADRRALRSTLRRQAPQTRAAARTRRARRGTAGATAKTLLVALGVPQDIANCYAPSFSRGTQVRTTPERVRLGEHSSKRVEVKRYTWAEFAGRLAGYHPGAHPRGDVAVAFDAARDRALSMA